MAQVTVRVNGRAYQVACEDGQEAQVVQLGNYVNQRATELLSSVGGQAGDARLMLMVSLLLADELSELYGEVERLRDQGDSEEDAAARLHAALAQAREEHAQAEEAVADSLEGLAERVETIVAALEQS